MRRDSHFCHVGPDFLSSEPLVCCLSLVLGPELSSECHYAVAVCLSVRDINGFSYNSLSPTIHLNVLLESLSPLAPPSLWLLMEEDAYHLFPCLLPHPPIRTEKRKSSGPCSHAENGLEPRQDTLNSKRDVGLQRMEAASGKGVGGGQSPSERKEWLQPPYSQSYLLSGLCLMVFYLFQNSHLHIGEERDFFFLCVAKL